METTPICNLPGCGKVEAAHKMMAHQFSPDAGLRGHSTPKPQVVIAADAILRLTLVAKGIITYDELTETEKQLRTAGLLGGTVADNRQDGSGGRKVRDDPQA